MSLPLQKVLASAMSNVKRPPDRNPAAAFEEIC
jgi:hypothetical protein